MIYTSGLCVIFMCLVIAFPIYLSEFLFQNYDRAKNNEQFRTKFDSLLKEFNIKKGILQINHYPVFIIRRTMFAAILVFLEQYPIFQLILIEITTFIVILVYYIS